MPQKVALFQRGAHNELWVRGQRSSLRRPMRFRRFLEREYRAMADSQEAGTVDSQIFITMS
jgi:hypothetical protein